MRGRPGINARIALRALIIQTQLKTTDEVTVELIEENPYLQYFLGLASYTLEPIRESSSLSRIRQRLSKEDWQAINELVVDRFKKVEKTRKKRKKGVLRAESEEPRSVEQPRGQLLIDATCGPSDIAYPTDLELKEESRKKVEKDEPRAEIEEPRSEEQPRGQLILDAACVPSDIAYPTDLDLLNQAREKAEKILDEPYAPGKRAQGEKKPRTYRQKARRDYLRRGLQHIENRITQSGGWPLSFFQKISGRKWRSV